MKAVIAIPIWKRPELTNYVLRYYSLLQNELMPEIELYLVAVGSEGKRSRRIAERNGFDYIEYKNMPLNLKFNALIRRSKQHDPDVLFLIGSDDIISANYFRNIKSQSDVVVGLRDFYYLDYHTKRLGYWSGYKSCRKRRDEPNGPGRCFSREVLEKCDWEPWSQDKELMEGLDGDCQRKLLSLGIKMKAFKMEELGCFAMGVKTKTNIWSRWDEIEFEKILNDEECKNIFKLYGISDIFNLSDSENDSQKIMRLKMYHLGHIPHLMGPETIELLKSKINKNARVLETGAGMSTIWFAQRAKSVESFEHNPAWFNFVLNELKIRRLNNVNLHLYQKYPKRGLDNLKHKFDIIFIDGRGRYKSILTSIKYLKFGGLILLDDAYRDYYSEARNYLDNLGWNRMKFLSIKKLRGKAMYTLAWIKKEA